MHGFRTQPRNRAGESFSGTATDTDSVPSNHAVPVNHTRILSRFFLSSLDQTITGSAGHMQLKVTKASAVTTNVDNRLKTIPHSLYDDPAFSADPSSNPLCSASHDIKYWITDPPKGHPAIKSQPDRRNRKVTPVPPPNSPISFHDSQQAPGSMIKPAATLNVSPSPSSPPDLSSTASSASDSSLKTPGTSPSSLNISQPSAGENKKRLGLSFFRRKNNSESTPTHRLFRPTKTMSLNPTTGLKHVTPDPHSPSVKSESSEAMMGVNNGKKPTVLAAQSAQALDMIDELDESNPLGISLHHGGPYEAIKRVVGPNAYRLPRAPKKHEQQRSLHSHQPFRFDVPLNLSPGQVLPHSVTAYYRPQVHMDSATNFRDRLGLRGTVPTQPVDQPPPSAMNRRAVDQSGMAPPAIIVTPSHTSYPSRPPNPALDQSLPPYSELADQTQQNNSRDRVLDTQVSPDREPRPTVDGMGQLTINGSFAAGPASADSDSLESDKLTEEAEDRTRIGEQLMTGECEDSDDDQGTLDSLSDDSIAHGTSGDSGNARLRYLEDPRMQTQFSSHGPPRNTPPPPSQGLSRNASLPPHRPVGNMMPIPYGQLRNAPPPPNMYLSPHASYDPYRRQEFPTGPLIDRRAYESQSSAPSSSSSIQSGAASTKTGITAASSATSNPRNRILPRQLVMPAPLAKAAVSSRPQPTYQPQPVQGSRGMQRQHHIQFHDGAEYEMPVTQMNPKWTTSMNTPIAHPTGFQSRAPSVRRGKLKKHNSLRGPEPSEIIARLATAPQARPSRKYMEPPPTVPETPRVEGYAPKDPIKRLLSKRVSMF